MGDFPELSAAGFAGRFPILETGIIIKVNDAVSDVDVGQFEVGQFVVIKKSPVEESKLSLLLVDEADAMSSRSNEVGARVSGVEDMALTLEIMSPLDDGGED